LNAAFETFKAEHTKSLKDQDVVQSDKVEKINSAIGEYQGKLDNITANMQKAIDDVNDKLAQLAANAGAASNKTYGDMPASTPEYIAAFKANMRHGENHEIAGKRVAAALTKSTDGEGGYLAPVEWDRTITDRLKIISEMRKHSRVISISTAGFKKLFTDGSFGSGWVGETAARPQTTTPTFGALEWSVGEIYANPAASQQMLDDAAIDLEQWIKDEVEAEFAKQEGIAFLSGNGTNKPHGILTYVTGEANAARHPYGAIEALNSGAAAAFTSDGIIDLMYALPAAFASNAKFYTNRTSLAGIRKLKDGQGNYLWQPSYVAGQPQTINGSPVVDLPGMPAAAAGAIAALYGDMEKTYLIVDRVGISVLRDPYTNKPFVHFYTTKRVGGGVVNPEPMKAL
ncbi:phage major capsid protein, partial [Salmonella enterica subsp. enterica serovar Kottbus]|nr:phage major capsid protein [Salmonella enterica subsp. enterica serovar Kottbus]